MTDQKQEEQPTTEAVQPPTENTNENQAASEAIEKARSMVGSAWKLAAFSATLTTLFAVAGFFITDATGPLAFFLDPWSLFDAIVLWVLTYFVRKQSFAASLYLVAYWVLSVTVIHLETGVSSGIFIRLFFLFIFVNGARGAYQLRSLQPQKPRRKLWRVLGWTSSGLVAVIVIAMVALGALMELGYVPSPDVEAKEDIPSRVVDTLRSEGVLKDAESIDMFYSAGLFDIMEDGNLITDQRVISYWRNETNELEIQSATFADVQEVYISAKGDSVNDTLLTVLQSNGEEFQLYLPVSENGDTRFYNRLNQLVAR